MNILIYWPTDLLIYWPALLLAYLCHNTLEGSAVAVLLQEVLRMSKNYRTYHYQSLPTRQLAHCLMAIFTHGDSRTVVLREAPDNPGQSITTASETIATSLTARESFNPTSTCWIEYWPAETSGSRIADEYSLVSYTWNKKVATNPTWQALSIEEANRLMAHGPHAINNHVKDGV